MHPYLCSRCVSGEFEYKYIEEGKVAYPGAGDLNHLDISDRVCQNEQSYANAYSVQLCIKVY